MRFSMRGKVPCTRIGAPQPSFTRRYVEVTSTFFLLSSSFFYFNKYYCIICSTPLLPYQSIRVWQSICLRSAASVGNLVEQKRQGKLERDSRLAHVPPQRGCS